MGDKSLFVRPGHILGDLTLTEMSTECFDSNWTFYWSIWLWLNFILGDLALVAELYIE